MKKISSAGFLYSAEDYLSEASQEALWVEGYDVIILGKADYDKLLPRTQYGKQNKALINKIEPGFLNVIQIYLEEKGARYQGATNEALVNRENGKAFSTADHVKALIYAQLSDQTKWHRIQPHLEEIDELFHNYNIDEIQSDGGFYSRALFSIKCGSMKTESQMASLSDNIAQIKLIICECGSMEAFVLSKPAPEIVELLSKRTSPYKLKYVGEALAWEYLRNVGIDGAKPDTHLRRFLGSERMGVSNKKEASTREVYLAVLQLAQETGYKQIEIDNLIWSFCADKYGEVCTATPKCTECPIFSYCNANLGS